MATLLAVVAMVLTACTSVPAADGEVAVRPIDEILATDIEVTLDPSGTAATLSVETTVPVACAVVYGPDEDFGAVAVDQDMSAGAHREHGPLLTGLEPDTEYSYVLQGSDTAGRLYRSQVMTFRTPVAQAALAGTNVAPDSTILGVSSEFSDGFAAELAIDGDLGTAWASAGDGDDAWIEIDLGAPTEIVAVRLRSRSMTDGTSIIEQYTLSVDGADPLGPFDAGADLAPPAEVAATGQRLRFDAATTTGGNTGAVELEVYTAE
jgi:hypothetical protein